jgi:protein-L-isoaspartate(D-aspartate) O-methyltransferase
MTPPPDFAALRRAMVADQLRARGLRDPRVLDVMGRLPREHFVPEVYRPEAYDDRPLGIGGGQTISQPYMVALMTEALDLKGDERVLEIGTGSGYQTAVLAALCREVFTVERVPELAEEAQRRVSALGFSNVRFRVGDGTLGWKQAQAASPGDAGSHAPPSFDAILVTAGAPDVPQALIDQLADGGTLVIPVGDEWGQDLRRIRKHGDRLKTETLCRCVFVKLIGQQGWT